MGVENIYFNSKLLTKNVIQNKNNSVTNYIRYMLNRTSQIFEYENLPDTIPKRIFELYLQCNGNCIVTEHEGNLYAFTGGLGGVPDEYYRPTKYIVANPYLNLSNEYDIDKDCVLVYNDTMLQGLLPLHEKYSLLLTENDITMRIASINMRLISILSVSDDRTKESALEYLRQIENGNLGVLVDGKNMMFDSNNFNVSPTASTAVSNYVTQLAEYNQYLKASWFNDIGLQANYNMKRESLNEAETKMDSDILLPLVDDMLNNREIGVEKINKMFGTNISVKLNSAWAMKDRGDETNEEEENN